MATRHKHRWQRLSDTALFCGCGETKYVAEPICTRPHYYPTWIWQEPYVTPYIPTWQPTITTGSTSPWPPDDTTTITTYQAS